MEKNQACRKEGKKEGCRVRSSKGKALERNSGGGVHGGELGNENVGIPIQKDENHGNHGQKKKKKGLFMLLDGGTPAGKIRRQQRTSTHSLKKQY